MNINGQGHSLTLVQGHSDSTFSNFFFLETAKPIEAKFQMEPPWDRGTKVCSNGPGHITCSNGPGHMTYMAAMPMFGKIFFSGTKMLMTLRVCMQHRVLEYYQVYSNYDPGLT